MPTPHGAEQAVAFTQMPTAQSAVISDITTVPTKTGAMALSDTERQQIACGPVARATFNTSKL
jgi:hypothetical protein